MDMIQQIATQVVTDGRKVKQRRSKGSSDLYGLLEAAVKDTFANQIDELLRQKIAEQYPSRYVISDGKLEASGISLQQHRLMPLLCALVQINCAPVMLIGDAGSGKSSAAIQAAKQLGMAYAIDSYNPQSSKADLRGYCDVSSSYCESNFVRIWRNGGLYIADEFDACNPAIATVLNAALANRVITLPNGETIEQHPSFAFVACTNTGGTGATSKYVGRNRLDFATLDRFLVLNWEYDLELERELIGLPRTTTFDASEFFASTESDAMEAREKQVSQYYMLVQRARALAKEAEELITPRSCLLGARLIRAGIALKWVVNLALLRAGLSDTTRRNIAALPEASAFIAANQLYFACPV